MSASQATPPSLDLALCEREPIHIPGAIQPHGAMLAALADGWLVTHASENLAAILGLPAEAVLGRPLEEAIGAAACRVLQDAWLYGSGVGQVHSYVPGPNEGTLHLYAHRSGRHICVDIEPERSGLGHRTPVTMVHSILETFKNATTRAELCERAVRGLKAITGFDRVMAYRFDRNGHGEVIAEACEAQLEPYLGLHYPAGDIPPQARRLFLRQSVCSVADFSYQPVPLLADPKLDDGVPIDLTHSALRSVSPIHREYMRNMNTLASLTIGLAHGSELWGMLVCHHVTPRIATPELRASADMIGRVVSLLLDSLGGTEVFAQRLDRNVLLRRLVERVVAPLPLAEMLVAMEPELLQLMNATGAMVHFSGLSVCLGHTPPAQLAERAFALLHLHAGGELLAVDDLGLSHPGLAGCTTEASGALMLPLGRVTDDAILWFRPEVSRTVTWGGDPAEHATLNMVTGQLSPRASFAAWKETVRGHSAPWTEADLDLARELRHLVEVEVARRTKMALDQFSTVFEASPTALVLAGPVGQIMMMNRQAERMFGYDRTELQEKPLEQLMPERFRRGHVGLRRRFLAHKSQRVMGQGLDLLGLRKDGTEFPVEIGLSPIEFDGNPLVLAGITDITARRENEIETQQGRRELERSNADLQEFAYAISHDLKAPLRAIGHLVQWIGDDTKDAATPETIDNLRLLQGRVERMQLLLEGLLEYSRVGQADKITEDVAVADVINDIIVMQAPQTSFVVSYEGEKLTLRTQRVALQVVLNNLVSNSVKHHDRTEGRVVITTRLLNGLMEFRVSDDGPGIPEQFHHRIFIIFQTLKSRDDLEASGIGLAIVKRKVERHGGQIRVESAPPARGASFVFTWGEAAP